MLARGLVIDSNSKEPLSRANIVITDADGNVIGNAGDPGGVIEAILDSNREKYLSIGAYRARMQAITEASIPDYSKPTILYDDKSDKSTTTTIINTSTYIDTGTAEILGSGNNSHEVVTPDGTIYSW